MGWDYLSMLAAVADNNKDDPREGSMNEETQTNTEVTVAPAATPDTPHEPPATPHDIVFGENRAAIMDTWDVNACGEIPSADQCADAVDFCHDHGIRTGKGAAIHTAMAMRSGGVTAKQFHAAMIAPGHMKATVGNAAWHKPMKAAHAGWVMEAVRGAADAEKQGRTPLRRYIRRA